MLATTIAETLRPLHVPGTGRLLGPFVPRTGTITTTYAGYTIDLDLSDEIQWQMAVGCYERWETRQMLRLLKPGMTVLDVGANVGHYTFHAAQAVGPAGTVIAVEPYPWAATRIERTAQRNDIRHIHVEHVALSDTTGESRMNEGLAFNHNPSLIECTDTDPFYPVRVERLDDVLPSWGIGRIDFCKVDIEGSEPQLVKGAQNTMATGRIRYLLMEFNTLWLAKAGSSPGLLRRALEDCGFTLVTPWPRFHDGMSVNLLWRHSIP